MKRTAAIAVKAARDYRTPALSIALVLVLVAVLDIGIYPSYRDSLADFEIPDALRGLLGQAGSLSTPEGFIAAEFFGWVPLLLIVLAIVAGTGTTAGEEAAGTLELLLAQPISRTRVLLAKALGLAVLLLATALTAFPAFVAAKLFVEFDVTNARLFAAVVNMVPITWTFLAFALLAAVTLPSRGAALTAVIGVLVAAYFVYSLGAAVEALANVRKVSPFYWADGSHVLLHGMPWLRQAGFLAVAGVVLGAAVFAFERREIAASQRGLFGMLLRRLRRAG